MRRFHDPKNSNLHITLSTLLAFISTAATVCYDPNGDTKSDPIFQPCGNSGTTSMCCASNRSNPSGGNYANGLTADVCLENGLCENKIFVTYDQGETTLVTLYYRDYCTSSNWKTGGGCLNVCTEETVCFKKGRSSRYQLISEINNFNWYIRIPGLASLILLLP